MRSLEVEILDFYIGQFGAMVGVVSALTGVLVHRGVGFTCLVGYLAYLASNWIFKGATAEQLNDPDLSWIANMGNHIVASNALLSVVGFVSTFIVVRHWRLRRPS